jgi:hypothetical protein
MTPFHLKELLKNVSTVKETSDRGFHVALSNGYNISIQWKEGNYCHANGSTAEVAVWDKEGRWVKLGENDDVVGWQSASDILDIMYKFVEK